MKPFYKKAILFWFVLLILAFFNAAVREATYKPLLTPYIGSLAHQISSITGILLFFVAIYVFLKKTKADYSQKDLVFAGLLWIFMTILFETAMNVFVRQLSFQQVLQTYYFWEGETWVFVLLSLLVSPQIIFKLIKRKNTISKN
jgi:uncharacterized membrane protein